MGCVICWGMRVAGMFAHHLACLLARSNRPYAAELNVGRVNVNEYGHVRSWEDITSVLLVMDSSSNSECTRYVEFS